MNDAFCVLAWIGLHINPDGDVYPCCVSDHTMPYGNIHKDNSVEQIFRGKEFTNVRKMMLAGKKPPQCNNCYRDESQTGRSARIDFNESYKKEIKGIKIPVSGKKRIRMLDIRFSNICNMKCRTCGPGFSSLWAQEERSLGKEEYSYVQITKQSLDEILELLPTVDHIYFAGGEPLIMDEHYKILEEIQRLGLAKKIHIRYSSNLSNIQYKKKDLLDLWKGFNLIDFSASLDHYGERAEYIRHGTNWGTIEENIKKFQSVENLSLNISTTISVFNFVTYHDFFDYMKEHIQNVDYLQCYPLTTPEHFSATVLPVQLKSQGVINLMKLGNNKKFKKFKEESKRIIAHAKSANAWNTYKKDFQKEITLRDKIRGEDFCKTFPELKEMLDA